jgi:hypothetical protein
MFRFLFGQRPRSSRPAQRRYHFVQPWLEALEERTLLATRFIVPVGIPFDGVTTFPTLEDALTTTPFHSGDTIQIEPGSNPGNVIPADLTTPGVTNLTIQGDPNVALSAVPQFTLSGAADIGIAENGLTLSHINMGLIDSGNLVFFGCSATISGSTFTDIDSTSNFGLQLLGPSEIVQDSTFVNNASPGGGVHLVTFYPQTAIQTNGQDNNVCNGNTFEAIGQTESLVMFDMNITSNVAGIEQVTNNTFVANTGSATSLGAPNPRLFELFDNELSEGTVPGNVANLTVVANTFTDTDNAATAIYVDQEAQGAQIANNTINLTGFGGQGILVQGGQQQASTTTSAAIIDNQINTGGASKQGAGLVILAGANASNVLDVMVEGNDFHNNQIGVKLVSTASGSLGNVDLGGGGQGSLGGNDFRSFTAATPSSGGIVLAGTPPANITVIVAQKNIFGVSNPQTVVEGEFNMAVDTSNNLTGNAAFVQTVYEYVLHRVGNTSNQSDAGGWVTSLTNGSLTQAAVAADIVNSTESFDYQVNALYLRFLDRPADAGGQQADVAYLQGGGTLEQIIINIATSAEYTNRVGFSGGLVLGLYANLLGRVAASSEVNGWLPQLPTLGTAGLVNAVVTSTEFRDDVVEQLYSGNPPQPVVAVPSLFATLLHRSTAGPADVSSWVSMNAGIITIEKGILGSSEFFTNG